MFLGRRRGYIQDWITQIWARMTGRKFDPVQHRWLSGPFGDTDKIADAYVERLIEKDHLKIRKNEPSFGLLDSIDMLNLRKEEQSRLNSSIIHFYEKTFQYNFEIWSHWCGVFYPFGWLISRIFSKRLQQLNLPLNPLDSSQGIESNIWKLYGPDKNKSLYTIWYRILRSQRTVIYSGIYSTAILPESKETCLKVVFPLPNGNATVVMRVEVKDDGSLLLTSKGEKFGDPGFYFLLTNQKGKYWSRYVKAMHETIHVYTDNSNLRTDHVLNLFGLPFLKLHYKMTKKIEQL